MSERCIRYGATEEERRWFRDLVDRHGSPLLVVCREVLTRRYRALQAHLPGVTFYYAIKAFPHPEILRQLADLGCNFDVASEGEIELLRPLGVSGRRTIHTHPVKKDRDIRAALRGGATTFVVDNAHELKKFIPYRLRVGILLRVSFRSPTAAVDLSRKFGCAPEQVPELVAEARTHGLHVRGLAFHVGSQSLTPEAHVEAIERCARLIEQVNPSMPVPMNLLDIGGGYPVDYDCRGLDEAAYFAPIRRALAALPEEISVIAEPGRYLVAPAVAGISTVMGRARRGEFQWYYLDDGIYGSYSGQLFDHVRYPLVIPRDGGRRERAILAGPTCDSIDIVAEDVLLPELEEGDLVVGRLMGAYTHATATRFNSLSGARVVFVERGPGPEGACTMADA